jgi:predicted RNA binding protein YcfA (HicA-like mRNA interferase family)
MPRKIRELISDLEKAGFINKGGKGSHRNFKKEGHPSVTISGKLGSDAKPYQEKELKKAINKEH